MQQERSTVTRLKLRYGFTAFAVTWKVKEKKAEEREWCVGWWSCRIVVVQRANVWRRQDEQRCMRLERPEEHAEGLADAGRDAISGGFGFPFSSPMRRISSRARRLSTSCFSQLVHWISPFLYTIKVVSTIQVVWSIWYSESYRSCHSTLFFISSSRIKLIIHINFILFTNDLTNTD